MKKKYELVSLTKLSPAHYIAVIRFLETGFASISYFEASRDETVSILRRKMSCICPHRAYRIG